MTTPTYPTARHAQAMAYDALPTCRKCGRGKMHPRQWTRCWKRYVCDRCGHCETCDPVRVRETAEAGQ